MYISEKVISELMESKFFLIGSGEETIVSYLVKNGTDVNQTDHRGMTALDAAAMRGNAAVAAELLLIPGVYIEVHTTKSWVGLLISDS